MERPIELAEPLNDNDREQLQGCEEGGLHRPVQNEYADAWCGKCGERLLLTGFAGGPTA